MLGRTASSSFLCSDGLMRLAATLVEAMAVAILRSPFFESSLEESSAQIKGSYTCEFKTSNIYAPSSAAAVRLESAARLRCEIQREASLRSWNVGLNGFDALLRWAYLISTNLDRDVSCSSSRVVNASWTGLTQA